MGPETWGPPSPTWDEAVSALAAIHELPPDERQSAMERLVRGPSPWLRERVLSVGAAVLPEVVLVGWLRNPSDDVIRNAGWEMLARRGPRSQRVAERLARDGDPDVVLQAALLLGRLGSRRSVPTLRSLLRHPDVNVVQAAITGLGSVGDGRVVKEVLRFLHADPWLQLAAVEALGRLRSPVAVAPLAELVNHEVLGREARDALARLSLPLATRALAAHWLRGAAQAESDDGDLLNLTTAVESCPPRPEPRGFRSALGHVLAVRTGRAAVLAARCLLRLGPTRRDRMALDELARGVAEPCPAPPCLVQRADLVSTLLTGDSVRRRWAYDVARRHAVRLGVSTTRLLLAHADDAPSVVAVAAILLSRRRPALAPDTLALWRRIPPAERTPLIPVLGQYRTHLVVPPGATLDNVVLEAILGRAPRRTAAKIAALEPSDLDVVLPQVAPLPGVSRHLPWGRWLEEDPSRFARHASLAATAGGRGSLLPALRRALRAQYDNDVIRCVGVLGDRLSVPLLVQGLEGAPPARRVAILEALGRCGGRRARAVLCAEVRQATGAALRVCVRALSHCAGRAEAPVLQSLGRHPDWVVRVSVAKALVRMGRPEDAATLAALAADPVPLVAASASGLTHDGDS